MMINNKILHMRKQITNYINYNIHTFQLIIKCIYKRNFNK